MEANLCPQEFQDELTRVGGTNPYGEPIFRVVWGSYTFRWAGGYWVDGLEGNREVAESGDHWILQMWEPAECYGYPWAYYRDNRDEQTNLQSCGEFPYSGRYKTLQAFTHQEVRNGRMTRVNIPLSSDIIDMVVPIIMEAQYHSVERRKEAINQIKERKRKESVNEIQETLRSAAPAFGGEAVSFAGQGCKTTLLTKKMYEIENAWKRAMKTEAYRTRGFGIKQH